MACVIAGCAGDHDSAPAPSAEVKLDASTVRPSHDASPIDDDTPLDSGGPIDGMPHDAAPHDAPADTSVPLVPLVPFDDASVEPMTIAAVRGQRCDNQQRMGIVFVMKEALPYTEFIARALVFKRPLYAWPELSVARGACEFYDVPMPICGEDCEASGLICVGDGMCGAWPPELSKGARLTLSNGSASQVLDAELNETQVVELEGALSVRLEFDRYVVTLDATAIPEPITGLDVVRNGPNTVPETIDIRWTAPADGQVYAYSFLPIGHPMGFELYTECIADGAALEMSIEQEVLAPFVGRGFEFQGVDHAYFAAANTPAGCVEIRYVYRYWHDRGW